MYLNFIILYLYLFIIITSVSGYGLIFYKIIGKKNNPINFGYLGLMGIFFLTLYSYLSHLIIPHSQIHNSLVIIVGFLFFLFNFNKKTQRLQDLVIFYLIFFLLLSGLLISKNHDDFSYYHFPYTYYLTQHSLSFGIGKFVHGFRTPSSIFYINSLFYLPFAKYYLMNIYYILILGFVNIILIYKALPYLNVSQFKNRQINYINFFSLISFIFINIFFYRISEHGTDRSAQILIILVIIELLNLNFLNKIKLIDLINIYLISALVISIKAFFVLYTILIIPIFYIINKSYDWKNSLKKIFLNVYSFLFFLLFLFSLLTNFTNTGCFIYPLSFTCISDVSWGIPIEQVNLMGNWYELWSKAGAGPNFRVESPIDYIKNFNWVDNWIDEYFFNKVSDFILGLLLLFLVIAFIFNLKDLNYRNLKINNYNYIIYGILIILFLEWFFNHPALRYGGYCLIFMIIFIPLALLLSTVDINKKKYFRSTVFLIVLTLVIFNTRNITRISSEIEKYKYKPFVNTFYELSENHFRIERQMDNLIQSYNSCKNENIDCDIVQGKIKVLFGKNIYTK